MLLAPITPAPFQRPAGEQPTYLDRLNDLIKWACHEREQVERYGDTMQRNGWIQHEFVKAGAAICDNWEDWADDLDQSLNGEG